MIVRAVVVLSILWDQQQLPGEATNRVVLQTQQL